MAGVRPPVRVLFPSACGQRLRSKPWHWRDPRQRGLPEAGLLVGAVSRWRRAVAGGRGSRLRGFPGSSGHTAVSRPVCTALRRQGRVVARAAGPRHRRPRLRHEAHRRGAASAASGPRKARARVVTKVRQSAQPPADRSVQPLIGAARLDCPRGLLGCQAMFRPPVGSATRSNGRCALPHLIAPQGAQQGRHRRRYALPVPRFLSPPHPLQGLSGSLTASGDQWLCRSCHGSSAVCSSLLARVWNVMPQGVCVKAWPRCAAPAGRPLRSDPYGQLTRL